MATPIDRAPSSNHSAPSASQPIQTVIPRVSKPDYKLLAQIMVQEDKPFRTAALEAGYSQNTADAGPAALRACTPGFAEALAAESRTLPSSIELQAKCVRALLADVNNGESRGLEKAVETLGRMKVYDWFVRNSETNIGIFAAFVEPAQSQADDKTIDVYKE